MLRISGIAGPAPGRLILGAKVRRGVPEPAVRCRRINLSGGASACRPAVAAPSPQFNLPLSRTHAVSTFVYNKTQTNER